MKQPQELGFLKHFTHWLFMGNRSLKQINSCHIWAKIAEIKQNVDRYMTGLIKNSVLS